MFYTPLYFFVLQKQVLTCLKTEYFHSSSNDFLLSYKAFYCETRFQEIQGIPNFQKIQTKFIFARFKLG